MRASPACLPQRQSPAHNQSLGTPTPCPAQRLRRAPPRRSPGRNSLIVRFTPSRSARVRPAAIAPAAGHVLVTVALVQQVSRVRRRTHLTPNPPDSARPCSATKRPASTAASVASPTIRRCPPPGSQPRRTRLTTPSGRYRGELTATSGAFVASLINHDACGKEPWRRKSAPERARVPLLR